MARVVGGLHFQAALHPSRRRTLESMAGSPVASRVTVRVRHAFQRFRWRNGGAPKAQGPSRLEPRTARA